MTKPKERQPELKVFLDVRGFLCEPAEISELLGIAPDSAWREGEPIPKRKLRGVVDTGGVSRTRKYSNWRITSKVRESIDIDEHITNLMKRLGSSVVNFKKLPKDVNVVICAWIDVYSDISPIVALSRKTIEFLYKINAELDVDFSMFVRPIERSKNEISSTIRRSRSER